MKNIKIFAFDNHTGKDIPSKIDVFPVDLLLGNSISEIHSNITPCQMFCVFTDIIGVDFVVRTKKRRIFSRLLLSLLSFLTL